MQYKSTRILFVAYFFSFYSCTQEITVHDNLSSYDSRLEKEKFSLVVHCNAFTSKYGSLQKAASNGANVHCVVKKGYLSKYYDKQITSKPAGLMLAYAPLHDKLALVKKGKGVFEGYIGSAALSNNALAKNTEVVLYIPNAEVVPGFTKHVKILWDKAEPYKIKSKQKIKISSARTTSRRNRRGSCTEEELISCFDFEKEDDYDLVRWMADRIKVKEKRDYYISSMNLDHPVFIEQVKKAVCNGSTFSIIVNRDEKHLTEGRAILDLARFAQKYPKKIALVWKNGRSSRSNIHHAKLFVRSPNDSGENGLTIVPTANFTKKGGTEHNCAMILPHSSTSEDTIQALMEKYCLWWEVAEEVPAIAIPRTLSVESNSSKIADYVSSSIVPNQPCTYYLTTGAWGDKSCLDSIGNALDLSNGSIFKIILLKNWIKKDTGIYKGLKKLVIDYPDLIEIKSWDKGRKKKEIGGKKILTKGFTVFLRYSSQNTVLPYSVICPSNLAHAKKSNKDTIFTDQASVQSAIRDFEVIGNESVVI